MLRWAVPVQSRCASEREDEKKVEESSRSMRIWTVDWGGGKWSQGQGEHGI